MIEEQLTPREPEDKLQPESGDDSTRELGGFAVQDTPKSRPDVSQSDIVKDEVVAHAIEDGAEVHEAREQGFYDWSHGGEDEKTAAIRAAFSPDGTRPRDQFRDDELRQHVQRRLTDRINVYQEIYDSNPDRFANMPTSEFIEFTRKFEAVDQDFSNLEDKFNKGVSLLETIDTALNNKRRTADEERYIHAVRDKDPNRYSYSPFGDLLELVADGEELDQDTRNDIRKKFDDIAYGDDAFDKSPKQMLTEERELVENLLEHGVQALVKKAKEITDYATENFGDQSPMAQRYSEIASKLEATEWIVPELRELVAQKPQGRGQIKVS